MWVFCLFVPNFFFLLLFIVRTGFYGPIIMFEKLCRPIILEKGLEPLIRKAKASHESCKDVASAALRDLGFDNYL
jgi:hypothetical protein